MSQHAAVRPATAVSEEMQAVQEQVVACYQCGTCTGACPVVAAGGMDDTPRAIMRMIQAGLEQEVLSSRTIWTCASCYACVVRCPRDVEITDVMTRLRTLAIAGGYEDRAGRVYNEGFMDIVRRHGRMYEPELVVRYHVLTNPLNMLAMAPVGARMVMKRKLRFLPEHPEGRTEIRSIFRRLKGGDQDRGREGQEDRRREGGAE